MPDSLVKQEEVKQEEVKFGWYHVISADHILNFLKFSRVDGAVVRFQVFSSPRVDHGRRYDDEVL
jgi:hypothetical protein